ncbi:MAG: serine/threonine-protein phosphatase [Clostridia bacterium]|nr:serine/threonine-protein phosphatase [Clostridia bacterium]
MKFLTHGYTNMGGRVNNEDSYLCSDGLWVLADGLGGHDSGEVASKTAVDAIGEFTKAAQGGVNEAYLYDALQAANRAVLEGQKKEDRCASMRTTVVFAIADASGIHYANVGDSRFYYFKGGRLAIQSEDHTVSGLAAKLGDITPDQIRTDPDKNKLIKVLGEKEQLVLKLKGLGIRPEPGDAFLLCSDGFWEHVYEPEMELDLAKSTNPQEWILYMSKRILLRTKDQDNDNFTVIGVMIE